MNKLEVYQDTVVTEEILRVQESLHENGYAITNDMALGMPQDMHQYIDNRFYIEELLSPEVEGLPLPDRLRVCDVVEYRRQPGGIVMNEYPVITMRPVAEVTKPREYNRTYTLEDPKFVGWLKNLLSVVPLNEQQAHGTLGLNFVRTFQGVVAYKHQDNEQFVCIYVAARETAGAVTSLYPIGNPEETILAVALKPGEYLIFRDSDFLHDATPLQPRFEGDKQYRDAIVALVHYPTTFLKPNLKFKQ